MSRTQRLRVNLFKKNFYPAIVCALFFMMMAAIFLSAPITRVRSAGNPSVIVNKYFNGGGASGALDVVELLVIQNNLDMRGMIIKDFSASMANDGGGKYTFSNDALWSSVRSGTLIVLRTDNSAADTSVGGADYNLDLGMANTTYFTSGGGTFDIATTEMVMIKAAGSGTAGVTGNIHTLAGGTAGAQFTATAVPKLIATGTSASGQFVFANSTTQTINDFDGTDATGAATGLTFGSGNNANNTAYINSLRGGAGTPTPTPTPALSINDVSQAEGNAGPTAFTFTVSLSQPAPIGGVTFNVDTADGTAQDGTPGGEDNDYVAVHSTGVSIAQGLSSSPVTVTVNGDMTTEANETFFVNISSVTGASVVDPQGQGLILNDDGIASSGVVISQVYGGGGNSGATYRNDFIELYNRGATPVDLTGWSVQFTAPTSAFAATSGTGTPLTTNLSGIIQPGHYFLIQEAAGANVTTTVLLPTPDVTGAIAVGSTAGKVALVSNTTVLSGNCPAFALNGIVDFIGYGAADCSETTPTPVLTNLLAAIRNNNGCTDTDNNNADFDLSGGPIPRNSSITNACAGSGSLSGSGSANPNSVEPGGGTLLTMTVSPASGPTSTGITVTGNLSSIGGSATQQFYDDGTQGDVTLGDNVFSFFAVTAANTTEGAKQLAVSIGDAQARTASAFITLSLTLPTCGVERWSVKVGTDPDAALCDTTKATPVTLTTMRGWPAPTSPPLNARVAPYETTVWVVHGTLINYKKEADVDYHLVMQDGAGNTIVTEIPCPCCGIGSPFQAMMANARSTFDSRLTATGSFQNPNIPVRLTGVGFFDFIHGQTGVAPNGIEIHTILSIAFPTQQSAATTVGSGVTTTAGDATIRFGNVSAPGTTTVTPIDPSSAGPALAGYSLVGPAFNITTTAASSAPYNVCISVPYITDASAFAFLKLLHNEGGILVDRTTGQSFGSKIVCGSSPTLSPFVVAIGQTPTAANSFIAGQISTIGGLPVAGAVINLSGTQTRKTITDANGYYRFDDVETNGFYTVRPSRANFSFSPGERSFSQLGNGTEAQFTGSMELPVANPLDTPEYFVRQHYLDFLGREPDESGFNFWSDQILSCGSDAACIEQRTVSVSAAYFLSIEFQQTGGFVDALYRASYGRRPSYDEFMPDSSAVAHNLIVGRSGWQEQLAANKKAFAVAWVQRAVFRDAYDDLNNSAYVDALISHTGTTFTSTERTALIGGLTNFTLTRVDVLQQIAENEGFVRAKQNEMFVMMQYFGYLRRDPDESGYQFWLRKLNQFNGNFEQAEMVKAFLVSGEYRARFSQ